MKSISNNTKSISLRLSLNEHECVTQQANEMKVSLNTYIKKRLFDESEGCQMQFDQVMQKIPSIYVLTDQIQDVCLRNELKKRISEICRFLK